MAADYDPVKLGYGVICDEDVRGYGCHFHRKTTTPEPTTPETTKEVTTQRPFPVLPVVGGVVGAGVAAAGVGLIAAAVNDQKAHDLVTTLPPEGAYPAPVPITVAPAVAPETTPAVAPVPLTVAPAVAPETTPAAPQVELASRILKIQRKESLRGAGKITPENHVFGVPTAAAAVGACLFVCAVVGMFLAYAGARRKARQTAIAVPQSEPDTAADDIVVE